MGKTMFASDAALKNLLASSQSSTPEAPAKKTPAPKAHLQDNATKTDRKTKEKPATDKTNLQGDEHSSVNLTVMIDGDLFTALIVRKALAKTQGNKDENSFVKIVNTALRKYLASELRLVETMEQKRLSSS